MAMKDDNDKDYKDYSVAKENQETSCSASYTACQTTAETPLYHKNEELVTYQARMVSR